MSDKPNIFGLSPVQFIGALAVSAALVLSKGDLPPLHIGDVVAMVSIAAMAWWLFSSRRQAGTGEQERQPIAFRAGQLLKRVFRRLRGRAA
jgi:hypothetical protein